MKFIQKFIGTMGLISLLGCSSISANKEKRHINEVYKSTSDLGYIYNSILENKFSLNKSNPKGGCETTCDDCDKLHKNFNVIYWVKDNVIDYKCSRPFFVGSVITENYSGGLIYGIFPCGNNPNGEFPTVELLLEFYLDGEEKQDNGRRIKYRILDGYLDLNGRFNIYRALEMDPKKDTKVDGNINYLVGVEGGLTKEGLPDDNYINSFMMIYDDNGNLKYFNYDIEKGENPFIWKEHVKRFANTKREDANLLLKIIQERVLKDYKEMDDKIKSIIQKIS